MTIHVDLPAEEAEVLEKCVDGFIEHIAMRNHGGVDNDHDRLLLSALEKLSDGFVSKPSPVAVVPIPKESPKILEMRAKMNQELEDMLASPGHKWVAPAIAGDSFAYSPYRFNEGGRWGGRTYNFWNGNLGIGIIVGKGTKVQREDAVNRAKKYAVNTYFIEPFKDDLGVLCSSILETELWNDRRAQAGIKLVNGLPGGK